MVRPTIRNKPRTTTFKFEITATIEKELNHLCVDISHNEKQKTGCAKSRQTILGEIITDWVKTQV